MSFKKKISMMSHGQENYGTKENIEVEHLKNIIQELGTIINNQGDGLRKVLGKLSEISFRLGKLEEQAQLQRNGLRMQRDRLNMFFKTVLELGIVDPDIFNVSFSLIENKNLPITGEGKINANILLTRYDSPSNISSPPNGESL